MATPCERLSGRFGNLQGGSARLSGRFGNVTNMSLGHNEINELSYRLYVCGRLQLETGKDQY